MKTPREWAKTLTASQPEALTIAFADIIEQAQAEARLEGARLMQKAAHKCTINNQDSDPWEIADAIRAIDPEQVVAKGEVE